jgi:hypothetical protein
MIFQLVVLIVISQLYGSSIDQLPELPIKLWFKYCDVYLFSWEYAFSKFLTLITYSQSTCPILISGDCPSNKKQGICWWHSIRLLSSQHYNCNHSSLLEREPNQKNIMKSCYWGRICEQSSLMQRKPDWKNIMKSCYWYRIYDPSSLMEKEPNWKNIAKSCYWGKVWDQSNLSKDVFHL